MFGQKILSLAAFSLGTIFQSEVADAQQTLPDGSIDIGTNNIPGSSQGTGDGNWLVTASGSDIWGSWDHMHYMYFNRTTDTTVTMKINSWGGDSTNSWRKGGLMFRSHLGQRAAHSMMQLTGWGIAQQSRTCENCGTLSEHDGYPIENVWFRLVKEGNQITSYVKKDGEYDFMRYWSQEVDLGAEFMVGIALTSHDNTVVSTLDVSNFEVSDEVYSLPSDVGEVGETGESVWMQQYKPDMWSLKAAGEIGGTSDSFGFSSEEQTGNIVADLYLEKLERRNMNSKGGLMIRASHAPDAPHVSLLVVAGDGVTLVHRAIAGGDTITKNVGTWLEDVELRMEKTGDSVKCMYKHESASVWYDLGTVTAALDSAEPYLVGQAVGSSHWERASLNSGTVMVTPLTA